MSIEIEELNATNCKTYLLTRGDRAALVDPVRERFERYRRVIEERELTLEWVVETHTHADHLMCSRKQRQALGVPYIMHESSPLPGVDRHVRDGDTLELGGESLTVWHTPGHTPDSICLVTKDAILTGDTLFIGGSGRTDFPGGDAGAQYDAIVERIFQLDDDTVVWPGHDYHGHTRSTVGEQKRDNPRIVGRTREEYRDVMANLGLPLPDRIQEALQVNQSGFEPDEVEFPRVAEIARVASVEASALAEELKGADRPLLIDVREPEEFVGELGHVEGALLVPLDALSHRLPKLAGYVDREVVLVCRAGARSATAAAMLESAGFRRVRNLRGGMLAWAHAGQGVQR